MAEAPPVQTIPTPSPNIERAGDWRGGSLPLLYEGTPLAVASTMPRRLGAALRGMWLGDIIEGPSGPTAIDRSFDGVAAANATSFAEDRWWLSQARSRAEFDMMASYAEQRRRDRVIAMENPVTHFIFSAALDPSNVVTAGSSWVRAGATVAQRFVRSAAVNAVTVGATEMLHQALSPSATMSESMQAVAGAAIFGGLIGTVMRPTRPSAMGLGRYLDGQRVDAAAIGRNEGAPFLRSDHLADEAPHGEAPGLTMRAPSAPSTPLAAAAEAIPTGRPPEPPPPGSPPPVRGPARPGEAVLSPVSREAAPAAAAATPGAGREGVSPRAPTTADTRVPQATLDAARTGQPLELPARPDGTPVTVHNPLVVKSAEDMHDLVGLLRPIARELANARARLGPDAAIDLASVLPSLDAVLHAHGYDGLVTGAGMAKLRDAALDTVRGTAGAEAHELERVVRQMLPDDHPHVAVVDRAAQLFAPGVEDPVAGMRQQIGAKTGDPPVATTTVGRISAADDWGTTGHTARDAGAAGTPAASVTQTGEFRPLPTGLGLERLGMSPMQRLIASPIDFVGESISKLTAIPYKVARNLQGKANPANVDSDQLHWKQRLAHTLQDYNEAFLAHRGVSGLRVAAQELTGTLPAGKMSASDFASAVWERLHAQSDHALPEVNRAAASMRKLYDEMGDAAAGVQFFDQATVRTPKVWHTSAGDITESYVNRIWNTAFIQQNIPAFTREVEHWLQISGGDPRRAPKIVEGILTDRPFRAIDDEHVGQATSSYRRSFDAPSTHFARWLVTDPQELLATYTRTMGPDISLKTHAGAVNAKPMIDGATEEWMREIGRRAGTDGQAVYDTLQKELDRVGTETQAAYKAAEQASQALTGMPPSLAEIATIRDNGLALKQAAMDTAKSALQAPDALWAHMLADLDDLKATRDLLRGTYGQWDDSMDWVPRVLASARKIAMMTGLTGVVSQLSDVGALVLKEGMARTFGTAISALKTDMGTIKMALHEAQLAGTALDMMNSGRVMAMHDLAPDISGRHTMVERVITKATEASFYVNMMNPWSTFMKGWASLVVGSRIADDVDKVAFQAVRNDVVKLHAPLEARLRALNFMQDARSIGYVPTAADRAAWVAEEQQIRQTIATLPRMTRAERMATGIAMHEHLVANPTAIPNGTTRTFSTAGDIADAKRVLAAAAAGHEQAMSTLARAGIDPEMAREIAVQLNTHQTVRDTLRLPNTERWSHAEARTAYRRAMAEDVENSIVSADKVGRSLWLSGPIGQTIGMFHAYGQATIQKLLIPAFQEKDSRLIAGLGLMVGAGIVSDQLRRWATGNNQPSTPSEALWRGIDRSGALGWFGNIFNAASSMFDNRFGPGFAGAPHQPGPLMPAAMGLSPDGMIRALGPVASRSRDLVDLTFRTATMDWGAASARDARRLLPLNNVTHLHFAFTQLEHLLAGTNRMEPAVQHDTRPRRTQPYDPVTAAATFMAARQPQRSPNAFVPAAAGGGQLPLAPA